MACGRCGAENRAAARFCSECGAGLAQRCGACAAELRDGARFCDACGTPTAAGESTSAPATGAVRKTVTVVFCDLGGSTGFGERVDPEVSREVMARYHALLQAVVDEQHGTVAKFMGDGMMALFGIPEIAEDDARRAVLAGLEAQTRFAAFATEVAAEHGEPLTLRVGVNTGEVVLAEGDADLVGDALNVAARLEKACRPGQVLVGEETWRLTRSDFAYEPLGEVSVAGRAEPVAVFELASDAGGEAQASTPFVGREAEIGRLRSAFDDVVTTSSARFVTVLGSPGVGKTRLARELVTSLGDAITAFDLRCDRAGDATLAPAIELTRVAAALGDGLEPEETRARLAELISAGESERDRVIDGLMGIVGAAPARSTEEAFWAFRRLIETLAERRPVVVVIDDIQWAESLMLDLLEHLAEWVREVPVLLVGLARPELRDVRPALAEVGRRMADVVALDGLDASATELLAARLLGTDHLPAELVARLPASTDGNPLFVRELVRMLVDDHVIERRGDAWELAIDADAVEVPPTIQSLLAVRIERLPADERSLLELASVVGAEFSLGALRDLADASGSVDLLLERLRRKELVEPTGTYWGDQPMHRFHHVLIRDATYRRLLKRTRAELHERVGQWTDVAAAGILGEHEAVIAFHYEQAHEYRQQLGPLDDHARSLGRRAAELLTVAAERALERDDLAAAGALATRALARLDVDQDAERSQLLLVACEALLSSGDVTAARPLVALLTEQAAGNRRLAAWATCFGAQMVSLTDPDGIVAAEAAVTEAATALESVGDGAGQAKAHLVRANLLARLGRVATCEGELDLALASARAAHDRRRVIAVLGAAPVVALWGPSPVARAGGRCLDVVRLLRITSASPAVEATSMRCQAVLEALRGRMDTAHSMLDRARAMLVELGLPHDLLETELLVGVVELIANDPVAAEAPLRAAYGGLGALGVGADAGQAAALLARALLAQGRVDEADDMAQASEALSGQNLKTAIAWRSARAEVLAARDDGTAVALAEEAVTIAAGTDLLLDHADACAALARVRATAGDTQGSATARADAARLYAAKGATSLAAEPTTPRQPPSEPAVPEAVAGEPTPLAGAEPPEVDDRPTIENAASRLVLRGLELNLTRPLREVAEEIIAEDVVRYDRRRVISPPTLHGREAYLENVEALYGQFGAVAGEAVAVRDDRLALVRLAFGRDGEFQQSMLSLFELDDLGQIARQVSFEEDDYPGAFAELDERFTALRTDAPGPAEVAVGYLIGAFHLNGLHEAPQVYRDDFVAVDHRPMGFPPATFEEFRERALVGKEMTPDFKGYGRLRFFDDRALLTVVMFTGTTAEGNQYTWDLYHLFQTDEQGKVARLDYFPEDRWADAVAAFEQARGAGAVGNAVTRALRAGWGLSNTGDVDGAAAYLAPEVELLDRRTGVSMPTLTGVKRVRDILDATYEVFDTITFDVLAVRGDRVALIRVSCTTTDGLVVTSLNVVESDADGHVSRMVTLDETDLAAAVEELDARWRVVSHAASAVASPLANRAAEAVAEVIGAFARRDWDWFHEQFASEVISDDRRTGVNSGRHVGRERLVDLTRSLADVGFTSIEQTPIAIRGDRLVLLERRWCDPDGFDLDVLVLVEVDEHDRTCRNTLFDPDDLPAALTELDERFAAGEAAAFAGYVRDSARVWRLYNAREWDEMVAHLGADWIAVDHRLASAGTMRSAADFVGYARGMVELVPDLVAYENEYLLLGERCGVSRVVARGTSAEGADVELGLLVLSEMVDGTPVRVELFALEQLDQATARFHEIEASPPA